MKKIKIFALCLALVLLLGSISVFSFDVSNKKIYFTRYSPSTNSARWVNASADYIFTQSEARQEKANPFMRVHCGNMPNYQYYYRPQSAYLEDTKNGRVNLPEHMWGDYTIRDYGAFDYKTYEFERTYYNVGTSYHVEIRAVLTPSYIDNTYSWCRYWTGSDYRPTGAPVSVKILTGDI